MMDLEEAVKTIREECKKHEYCRECPFGKNASDSCCITDASRPDKWIFKSDNPYPNSIFY